MDVLVIGAGMVGAACAYYCAAAGLRVGVVERGAVAGGTTSAGEGNILVSDKEPGAELDLALLSVRLWAELGERLGADLFELHDKGGVVVARSPEAAAGLAVLAERQRACGVTAVDVGAAELAELEPRLTRDVAGGGYYPQDLQVQPMLAAAELLRAARSLGATVWTGTSVLEFRRDRGGAVTGVRTSAAELSARWVVNAAGTWGGEVAALAGAPVPVLPRRGFILVTEPLPPVIRHKVYSADYVANVASDDAGLETSVVVEGTRAGTVLIGASRERVGFDRRTSLPVLRTLAARAVELFPFLAEVNVLRSYLGFRPYCPDHLPVIGPDPRVPGLVHACGHEGAGIGLSAATGHLIAQTLTGAPPDLDLTPFRPDRFAREVVSEPTPQREPMTTRPKARERAAGVWTDEQRSEERTSSAGGKTPGTGPRTGERSEPMTQRFSFAGTEIVAEPGQSVGAALLAAGYRSWRTTRHGGAPRGLFCGIGICFDCLVVVNGRPNQRACLTEVHDGDRVEPQEGTGHGH